MQTERQTDIIEAALDLINKKGIQGLTIKNLSKMLGISEPAIYRHFDNKIQILISLLDTMKKNTTEIFEAGLHSDDTSLQKTERLFARHFQSFAQKPALASVVFSEELFLNEELLTEKVSEVIEYNTNTLLAIIKEGQQKKEIRADIDAEHLSLIIIGTLRHFVKKWQFAGYSFDIQKEGEKLIQSVINLISDK